MTERRPLYTTTPTGETVSLIPETDWETRLLDIVRAMRDNRKDVIMWYDWRANVMRVIPVDNVKTVKLV